MNWYQVEFAEAINERGLVKLKTFTVDANLPNNFFTQYLHDQGAMLYGAEDILSFKASGDQPGPSKERLSDCLKGLEDGEVQFMMRSDLETTSEGS